jgi:hypothetical protein
MNLATLKGWPLIASEKVNGRKHHGSFEIVRLLDEVFIPLACSHSPISKHFLRRTSITTETSSYSTNRRTANPAWEIATPRVGHSTYRDDDEISGEMSKYNEDQLRVDRDWYNLDEGGVSLSNLMFVHVFLNVLIIFSNMYVFFGGRLLNRARMSSPSLKTTGDRKKKRSRRKKR